MNMYVIVIGDLNIDVTDPDKDRTNTPLASFWCLYC